jgi:hypothetical protein
MKKLFIPLAMLFFFTAVNMNFGQTEITGLWKTIDDETGNVKSVVEIFYPLSIFLLIDGHLCQSINSTMLVHISQSPTAPHDLPIQPARWCLGFSPKHNKSCAIAWDARMPCDAYQN